MNEIPDISDIASALPRLEGVSAGGRVVVAMSGGVDSSVVAGVLKHQGYDVVGITLQLYDHGAAVQKRGACCAGQDIRDAQRVADTLGIPHFVFDYESRFRAEVIDRFVDSYLAGETPIPCVLCNQTVKFTDLLAAARELGAEALATGHYVERRMTPTGAAMYRAADPDRDQSYFLFATTRAQLDYLRFPLGTLHKPDVRRLAEALSLPVASKPDSQDICFVPTGRYTDVIERLRPGAAEPGEIVHVDGRVLGRHAGIVNFTIGQRRGLGIAQGEPLFVVRVDPESRRVIVGPRDLLQTREILLREINWLDDVRLDEACDINQVVHARVRSTRPPQEAHLAKVDGNVVVQLHTGELGLAAGQACVLYSSGDAHARVLGGGWIARVRRAGEDLPEDMASVVNLKPALQTR
ncbi:MAG: tRNA 2-thiouridine(34) synthase MnmA [Hyphomicrobiaceae bacterium]